MFEVLKFEAAADRLEPGARVPWHRHRGAYMAILVEGSVEEAGESGRYRLGPGDFFIHPEFEAHADRVGPSGAKIINFAVPEEYPAVAKTGVIDIENFCEKFLMQGIDGALQWTKRNALPPGNRKNDWPDLLAAEIYENVGVSIADWAEKQGLAVETVSRGFGRAYGISPKAFRANVRARNAARAVRRTTKPLADIAHDFGYYDQAHFSRAVQSVTGAPPGVWRRSTGYNRP